MTILFALSSNLPGYGGAASGTTVTGAASLVDTGRLVAALATGSVKESLIADGISGAVLTISGTLTAVRTITVPDASGTLVFQSTSLDASTVRGVGVDGSEFTSGGLIGIPLFGQVVPSNPNTYLQSLFRS